MTDEIAKLYIAHDGSTYRVKVFEFAIGIERQPNGENILLPRTKHSEFGELYDSNRGTWDYATLGRLLEGYPYYQER